jgi:catechol 2,3-dioxygenase-like lactoylglutathione lyase family enzyme
VDTELEVVVVPVSDIDRAKRFYLSLGWREDADVAPDAHFRVVQLTPPGSRCSVHIGSGLPSTASPGSAQGLYLVVSDIEVARAELVGRGATVSEIFHDARRRLPLRAGTEARALGPDPHRRSYASYATFSDPDGNSWVLQEVNERLPGRCQ